MSQNLTVGLLRERLAHIPAETRINVTIKYPNQELSDHAVAGTGYDNASDTYDLFVDL